MKLMKLFKSFKMTSMLFIIFILFVFMFGLIKTYEGFNTDYPQSRYSPSTKTPIPTALDGTPYLSPDTNGNCPSTFERNKTESNSLCHASCKEGDFYYDDDQVYGCVLLNNLYPQTKYSKENYPFAEDKKTNIVSPTIDAKCPKYFDLDIRSGLCHTKCSEGNKFYGQAGCALLNTNYLQTTYDGSDNVHDASDNPYPIAADGTTTYISPTSNAICPKNYSLDYNSGLCHTECPSGTKFDGKKSGSNIIGCN